jgi:hypothetical protein
MTRSSNTTRRTFLSTAAGLAAAVATLPAASAMASAAADPIFLAIELHKAAKAAFYSCVLHHSKLETSIPFELRRSNINAHGETIVATDDPRWIAAERDVDRLGDAEIDAACALVSIAPTTTAGVIALLQYAVEADTDGHSWPTDLRDDADTISRSWHHFLIEMLAAALSDIAAQS